MARWSAADLWIRLQEDVYKRQDGDHPDPEITKQIGDGEQLFEVHGLRLLSCKK